MATVVQFFSYYAIVVAIFYYFYFNRKGPLSETELEIFCEWLKQNSHPDPNSSLQMQVCQALGSSKDDGNEFYMLNLIKRPTSDDLKAAQSLDIEAECKESTESLENCYGKRIMPLIFKRFSFPILIVKPSWDPVGISKSLIGKGITENFDFDMIAIVRYRSKRDFLEMVTDIVRDGQIHKYKQLSVNKTAVYIMDPFMPVSTWIAFTAGLLIVFIFYSCLFWVIAGAVF